MHDLSPLTRRCGACGYRYESTVDACPIDRRALAAADANAADLGSYRLLERLGEGGMGAVYRAVHRKLDRAVAIKVLQKDLTNDRGIINRFFHEARAANTIRHENVIEVYDFVEDGENVYFVMELLHGRDLHDTLHRRGAGGPIAPRRAVRVLEQVAAGLHATHAREIVHRDLKPENIFLCHRNGVDDFVKIIDFGVAKLARPDGLSTVAGAVLGTPEYIAPEQARGVSNVDGRADIYSLGCIAYEMLTLHQVFGGGTRTQVLANQIKLQPPPLRHFAPELSPALESAVMRALAKDPAARPQSALAFAESLVAAIGQPLGEPVAFQSAQERAAGRRRRTSASLVLRAPIATQRRAFAKLVTGGGVVAALFVGAVVSGQRRTDAPMAEVAASSNAVPAPAPRAEGVAILLESFPSGATVVADDGTSIGVTPVSWIVSANTEREVFFRMPGFAHAGATISRDQRPHPRRSPRRHRPFAGPVVPAVSAPHRPQGSAPQHRDGGVSFRGPNLRPLHRMSASRQSGGARARGWPR